MQIHDEGYHRWRALGSPQIEVSEIKDLVVDAIVFVARCTAPMREVIFDMAIDDEALLAAFNDLGANEYERAWIRQVWPMTIEERASVVAALWQYWTSRKSSYGLEAA